MLKGKNILVTGGAGFIGSHLVDKLIKIGGKVYVIDDLSTGNIENLNKSAVFWNQDISKVNISSLIEFMSNIDVVFHLAALARVQPSIENPTLYHDKNVTGTNNLLVAAVKAGVKKFVFSSSSSVYGNAEVPTRENHKKNPISPYALHKYIGEQYCKLYANLHNIDTVCLRYFNVYGDRMNLEGAYKLAIPIFALQIKSGVDCSVNNSGNQRRDFTCVNDVVKANILVASSEKKFSGEVFNVGNGSNTSVNELVEMLGGKKGKGKKVIEPFETLANTEKIHAAVGWTATGNLKVWISNYRKELNI